MKRPGGITVTLKRDVTDRKRVAWGISHNAPAASLNTTAPDQSTKHCQVRNIDVT